MKGILVIMTVFFVQVSASGLAQTITLKKEHIGLKDVFLAIKKQTDYHVVWRSSQIANSHPVQVDFQDTDLETALKQVLKGQRLTYVIKEKTIVIQTAANGIAIVEQGRSSEDGQQGLAQQTVTGTVRDSSGSLAGVSLRVKGQSGAAVTDANGKFSLSASPDAVLIVSYIGYRTREIAVNGQANLDILLLPESVSLDELVVVGFGTQKKINLTGAVSQITAEDLENRPVSNIGQALQGKIGNLNVTISNGSPNTAPALNVRGGTSFFSDKNDGGKYKFRTGSPLVLVDGIEMDINQLNPEDIASVSVLKDAASAAIYGARAAYGVMLVTTKKGRQGDRTKVEYSNSFQWNKPSAIPDLLDAYTIQAASIKATQMQNQTPSADALTKLDSIKAYMDDPVHRHIYYMDDDGSTINWVGNTDVFREAVKNYSPMMKHNVNLSGGSDKTTYYGSFGYLGQDGLYKINTDKYKRYNALLNVSSQISDYLGLELRSSYNNSTYDEPVNPSGKGGWWTALSQDVGRNINMPLKTPSYAPIPDAYTDNILSYMDYGSHNREGEETIVLGASPTITPLKGWKIKADLGFESYNFNQKMVVPTLDIIETQWRQTVSPHTQPDYVQRWKQHSNHYTINAYTDYTKSVDKHNFYGLAGYNQEWYTYDYLGGRGEQLLANSIPVIGQTLGNKYSYDSEEHWAIRGAFYRFTYNYDGKYLFESNGRYDGTSRFPKDRRFHFFPSFSGGWRVTGEKFADPIKTVVNDLKFRASYGSLGNQNVDNYLYIPSYSTIDQVGYLFDGTRPVGIAPPGLVDANLTWETASTIDFGVDMTLLKKLDLTFDWYRRKTTDILVAGDKLPAVIGTSAPTKNSGTMQTKGWELSVAWNDALESGFHYDVAFNLSDYLTEITKFDGNPNKLLSTLYAGQKMGEIWGYETVGTFQSQEQIDAAPSQKLINSGVWYPGDIQFKDLDGNNEISPGSSSVSDPGDRKILGNSTPRLQFGLNMNGAYKGFDLNLFFQGVGKRDYYIDNSLFWGGIVGATGTKEVYEDSWTPENPDAFFPGYRSKAINATAQTKYLQNAAYIRLKNVTLGYTIPQRISKVAKIERLRVYCAAYNIWELSKLPDIYDVEVLSANYPMIRSLAFGVQVGF